MKTVSNFKRSKRIETSRGKTISVTYRVELDINNSTLVITYVNRETAVEVTYTYKKKDIFKETFTTRNYLAIPKNLIIEKILKIKIKEKGDEIDE